MMVKETKDIFKPTRKQKEALKILRGNATNIMLYGGRRSGKTVLYNETIEYRAINYPGSRHLMARLRYSHAKTSLWHETLLPALKRIPSQLYTVNKSDLYVSFKNGSEIWVGGFDDKDRIEKLLGHEYATIYFNEVSQLGYQTILLGMSSLAQNIPGLLNKAYFDCNPPPPLHWSYKLFILKQDPRTGKLLDRPDLYDSLLMNPIDNVENLPPNYIRDQLDTLPDRERRRFRDGEFVKSEGAIYDNFTENMIIKRSELPEMEFYSAGTDFGLNMASVLIGWAGNMVYLMTDYGAYNTTADKFNNELYDLGWHERTYFNYCDPSAGERIQQIAGGTKANNSVDDGIDFIRTLIEHDRLRVCEDCIGWLSEVWDYRTDEKGRVIKENDHYMDASRYGIFSFKVPVEIKNRKQQHKPETAGFRRARF